LIQRFNQTIRNSMERVKEMKATIHQIKGISLAGKSDSGHWVVMDGPTELGGADSGARPLELFLLGVGGCTAMDVISILTKKRVSLDDLVVEIEAERAEEHPKVFTRVLIKFVITGNDVPEEAVQRAIELSQDKYCSAAAMLKASVPIETAYEIRPSAAKG